VDCFYEGPNFLAINPDECIDCGVCIPECPVHAIVPDNFVRVGTDVVQWAEINKKYSQMWPVITKKKDPMLDHQEWNGRSNKLDHLKE
jgi:ferredoxin